MNKFVVKGLKTIIFIFTVKKGCVVKTRCITVGRVNKFVVKVENHYLHLHSKKGCVVKTKKNEKPLCRAFLLLSSFFQNNI